MYFIPVNSNVYKIIIFYLNWNTIFNWVAIDFWNVTYAKLIKFTAICKLEKDSGPCNDGYKRWYFNSELGSCEGFIYGGCGGNLNKFKSFNHCNQFCYEAMQIGKIKIDFL